MSCRENSVPFAVLDDIKELYKKTPLKKRPIVTLPDERDKTPTPVHKISTVPEGRVSKRKMSIPIKRNIYSVKNAEVMPPDPISEEPEASLPVKSEGKAVNKEDIPDTKRNKPEKDEDCHLTVYSKKAWKNVTKQMPIEEKQSLSIILCGISKIEFNLRNLPCREIPVDLGSSVEGKNVHAGKINYKSIPIRKRTKKPRKSTSSEKKSIQVKKKQIKAKSESAEKQTSVKGGNRGEKTFTGSSEYTYYLSPELADIVGQKKMTGSNVLEAMKYVFLERNLYKKDRNYVMCDDELSVKLFEGKRSLHFCDVEKYLQKHLTLAD